MKPEVPAARRKFADAAEEMGYLYDKLIYWLYQRQDARRARPFADRLERLLAKSGPETECIFAEECRSLAHEARGDLAKAIRHRENEVRLIRRLHKLSERTTGADFIFRQYTYADLSDRLDLLAVLQHDSGNLAEALNTLEESRRLCEKHGVKFDGEDLLKEYREEKRVEEGLQKPLALANNIKRL
jgi:hypothetical protein